MGKRSREKREKKSLKEDEPPVKRQKDELELAPVISSDEKPSKKV